MGIKFCKETEQYKYHLNNELCPKIKRIHNYKGLLVAQDEENSL